MSERPEEDRPYPEELADRFFRSTAPATNHEEWLLRMHAQLMHREACVVSVLEARAGAHSRRAWRSSKPTDGSTAPSMDVEESLSHAS